MNQGRTTIVSDTPNLVAVEKRKKNGGLQTSMGYIVEKYSARTLRKAAAASG